MSDGVGFDYGRGQGLVYLLAAALIIFWPFIALAIVWAFAWYVVRPAIRAGWRHKVGALALAFVGLAMWRFGTVEGLGFSAGVALAIGIDLVGLRLGWPHEFARYVSGPWTRQRRKVRLVKTWVDVTVGHGLGHITHQARRLSPGIKRVTLVPRLRKVSTATHVDRIVIRPLYGQTADHWSRQCDALALAYGALECRVGLAGRGHLHLDIVRHDPLTAIVPALTIAERIDLAAIPVGLCEDGTPWTVRLEANHLLVAGATGSGKGSVLWSILRAVGPGVRDGWVQVWAVDPKGGQELYAGQRLFHRYADESPEAMVELLEAAVAAMEERAKRYRGRLLRKHRTSVDEPLVLIVIDELADLTTLTDRKLKEKAAAAISTLLRKGRSVGFCVVAAVQDPAKDIVPFRQLIPTRIGLRLSEKGQVAMVLGEGMREAGGYCDRIPHPGSEGVAYVVVPRRREPLRVRAAWVTDEDIAELAERYQAPSRLTVVEDQGDHDGGPEGGTPVTLLPPAADELRDAA
jgi:S-DNA-T family DNA segregation ATPase FtsK/SpoIIIE